MNKENQKNNAVCLYGGSFDPVQNAHVEIINNLSARFNKVIVVPSFLSPFKKGGSVASGQDRLDMLKASMVDGHNIEISDFEIVKEGISYSIDTVKHFAKQHKGKQLYFCIGSEMLKKLHKWHEFNTLKNLVTFYVVGRPGFFIADSLIRRLLKKHEAKLEIADFNGLDGSSSLARVDAAFNKFNTMPNAVADIVVQRGLYKEFLPIVERFIDFDLSIERVAHIYRTVDRAVYLAKLHNANINDVIVAALLHDIAKEIECISEFEHLPSKIQHAFYGAEVAKQVFGFKKKGILEAIRYHTTGAPKMSKVAKILFIADFTESGRDFETEKEFLQAVRAELKLNAAVRLILEGKVKQIEDRGDSVFELTKEALEFYTPKAKVKAIKAQGTGNDITKASGTGLNNINNNSIKTPHLAHTIANILYTKNALDITLINLDGKTIIADYFVVCSATNSTAVRALTEHVDEVLSKKHGIEPLRRDTDKNWYAIDYGSVILHVQLEQTRQYFNLERLWSDGQNIERIG